MILQIGWIPHAFSIASWWYQRVSYGIMIHSLTPGSVGQESTGDGSGSRFVSAHAQGWGGGCGFMDVMSHWQVSYKPIFKEIYYWYLLRTILLPLIICMDRYLFYVNYMYLIFNIQRFIRFLRVHWPIEAQKIYGNLRSASCLGHWRCRSYKMSKPREARQGWKIWSVVIFCDAWCP